MEVQAVRISKAWSVKDESKCPNEIIAKMNDLKHTFVKDNVILQNILYYIPQLRDPMVRCVPQFYVNGEWYAVARADMSKFPYSIKVFQMKTTQPEPNGFCKRKSMRLVEIIAKSS